MKKWTSKQIRQTWLDFWKSKEHHILPSKSLIPINDPSLLWINSGVATLKPYFSGQKMPPHPRLANVQKSLRTNDIENVGLTARHHTLFEMLGNFSIGEYFKKEAIKWAYELLFEVFKFEKEKIYITYFAEDQEAYQMWLALKIDPKHLIPGDRKMNFWDIGQGPCGPNTEIFYDRGEQFDINKHGIKLLEQDLENDRYVEIWNIVFSQFNNDGNNNYETLQQKNIDTGAGLERLTAILQNAPTNFDTDLFLPIIKKLETLATVKYEIENYFKKNKTQRQINRNFQIIADHIRAVALAIEDGAKPANTKRGYIIRRLIRRAYRAGLQLGIKGETFLAELVPVVAQVLTFYPINVKTVQAIITKEELIFAKTITQGEQLLKAELKKSKITFDPYVAFKLFETYGFPLEMTKEILAEKKLHLDQKVLTKLIKEHENVSKTKLKKAMANQIQVIQKIKSKTSTFVGYDTLKANTKLLYQGQENNKWYVLLAKTPFYPTGGGQRADYGTINEMVVNDVFKDKYGNVWHVLAHPLATETNIEAQVDPLLRSQKAANHSATHLLAAALVKVFGKGTIQLGSDNDERRLTYDFPLDQKATSQQLQEVEKIVNDWISQDLTRTYLETTPAKALEMGAVALEDEEYGAEVRVVRFGDHILDFCGGTHVAQTSLVEQFKIIKFESRGTGIFRITALTTNETIAVHEKNQSQEAQKLLQALIVKNQKIEPNYALEVPTSLALIEAQIEKAKQDYKKLFKTQKPKAFDFNVSFTTFQGKKAYLNLTVETSIIKPYAVALAERYPQSLIILGAKVKNGLTLAVASQQFDAQKIFQNLAHKYAGKGGGNQNFAMGKIMLVDSL